nr:alpha/beta hydrolase [uncultured Massilia sp.]
MDNEQRTVSIVLVHGAFVDGSGWSAVHALLSARGYEVLVVQHATLTLDGDVAATGRVIRAARHPVVLVGHSYGGAVIGEAGDDPKVKALVYLAAFVPDVGESIASLNDDPAAPGETPAPILPPQDGFLVIDPAQFAQAFAADVDAGLTRFMADAQLPWGLGAVTATATRAAWRCKPAHYLVATEDRMIPPRAQWQMAGRAGAHIAETGASHALMLSRPDVVAAFIERAAAALA